MLVTLDNKRRKEFSTRVTMEAMMITNKTTKILLIMVGLFVLLSATAAWAIPPRVKWQPAQLAPYSMAPGESGEFVVTLKHTGFLPIPTRHLQVVAIGDITPFIAITQPDWPRVLKWRDTVDIRLRVTVPQDTPLSVKEGELVIQRVLPNEKIKEIWRAEALPIVLTFSTIPLPPDPGKAGEVDLLGIDIGGGPNNEPNGVRDDIDHYIVFAFPDSEKKREGLKQSARALSNYLRDRENKEKTRENVANDKSLDCLYYVFNDDLDAAFKADDEMIAQSLNTPARSYAHRRADQQMGGYASNDGPASEWEARKKAACVFDADSLPN